MWSAAPCRDIRLPDRLESNGSRTRQILSPDGERCRPDREECRRGATPATVSSGTPSASGSGSRRMRSSPAGKGAGRGRDPERSVGSGGVRRRRDEREILGPPLPRPWRGFDRVAGTALRTGSRCCLVSRPWIDDHGPTIPEVSCSLRERVYAGDGGCGISSSPRDLQPPRCSSAAAGISTAEAKPLASCSTRLPPVPALPRNAQGAGIASQVRHPVL